MVTLKNCQSLKTQPFSKIVHKCSYIGMYILKTCGLFEPYEWVCTPNVMTNYEAGPFVFH